MTDLKPDRAVDARAFLEALNNRIRALLGQRPHPELPDAEALNTILISARGLREAFVTYYLAIGTPLDQIRTKPGVADDHPVDPAAILKELMAHAGRNFSGRGPIDPARWETNQRLNQELSKAYGILNNQLEAVALTEARHADPPTHDKHSGEKLVIGRLAANRTGAKNLVLMPPVLAAYGEAARLISSSRLPAATRAFHRWRLALPEIEPPSLIQLLPLMIDIYGGD